jgi:chemotaxis protein MotB
MLKSAESAFFGICRERRTLLAARGHRGRRYQRVAMVRKPIPLVGLILSACVSQAAYNEQAAQLKEARAQAAAQQTVIAKMQTKNRWVMAGDLLFPEGGYRLSPAGEATLSQYLPELRSLQNTKVVVYGFTDSSPVGLALRQAGVADNIDLSSRRADAVVAYLGSQGINPNILSAKGFGDTHPVAPNATPEGRAQNRRIEIVLEGAGA